MKAKYSLLPATLALGVSAMPLSALAHSGAGAHTHGLVDSFSHAFAHPFTGADHLAAMLAVGVWSAIAVKPVWRAPAVFVALLLLGAIAGFTGFAVPGVEPMIAASVLVLGLLVAVQKQMPWIAAASLAGVFAFFHGAAHGYELAGDSSLEAIGALLGMASGSALLHLTGVGIGQAFMERHRWVPRVAGVATAMLGAFMLTRLA